MVSLILADTDWNAKLKPGTLAALGAESVLLTTLTNAGKIHLEKCRNKSGRRSRCLSDNVLTGFAQIAERRRLCLAVEPSHRIPESAKRATKFIPTKSCQKDHPYNCNQCRVFFDAQSYVALRAPSILGWPDGET